MGPIPNSRIMLFSVLCDVSYLPHLPLAGGMTVSRAGLVAI